MPFHLLEAFLTLEMTQLLVLPSARPPEEFWKNKVKFGVVHLPKLDVNLDLNSDIRRFSDFAVDGPCLVSDVTLKGNDLLHQYKPMLNDLTPCIMASLSPLSC